jgi:hypothetical protein
MLKMAELRFKIMRNMLMSNKFKCLKSKLENGNRLTIDDRGAVVFLKAMLIYNSILIYLHANSTAQGPITK